jgi:alpha-N-arabinofuranosidase
MANMAQVVNVIAPIFTNEKGMFLQTIYHPLALFANNARGRALELYVDAPTYKTRRRAAVPYLDVSAALDGNMLVLNAVNRHKDEALEGEFVCQDKQFRGNWTATEVNGPDIKAENDFGVTKVGTERKSVTVSGNTLRYRFPAHSYTMLKGEVG